MLFRFATVVDAHDTLRDVEDGIVLSGPVSVYVLWESLPFFHDRLRRVRLLIDGAEYARQPDGRTEHDRADGVEHMLRYDIDTRRLSNGPHRLTLTEYAKYAHEVSKSVSNTVIVANPPA